MCFIIKLELCKAKLHLCKRREDVSDDLKMVSGAWSVSTMNLAPIRYLLNLFIPHTTAKPSRSGIDHRASELESFLLENVIGKSTPSCSWRMHAAIALSDASVGITNCLSSLGNFNTGSNKR